MMDTTNTTRWDTGLYDDKHSFVWKHGASLLELLVPRAGERILDLGCGTGHLTARIAEAGADVVGIDASSPMVEEARRLYPTIRFGVADARDFSFEDPFDAVFSNAVLHWVAEPEKAIACVRKALEAGRAVRGGVRRPGEREDDHRRPSTRPPRRSASGPGNTPGIIPASASTPRCWNEAAWKSTEAFLFDRPTLLEGEDGLRHWVEMFVGSLVDRVPPDEREGFFRYVEDVARPTLHRDGRWFADYRRLRIVARRADGLAI